MRDVLRHALDLPNYGWKIFPIHSPAEGHSCDCYRGDQCQSPSKHPRTVHGLHDASDSFDQVLKWWRQWPSANIGIATGAVSGIVVIDVDSRHEGDVTWAAMCEEHGYLHEGPVAITGGGGWHYFFKHPGADIRSTGGMLGQGLDVRGDGGYIVAPPSVHATGLSYAWVADHEPWNVDIPPIPDWLLKAIARSPEWKEKAPPVPNTIPEGARHSWLTSLAGSMRQRNMSESAIFAALMAENAERCAVPMEMTEIARIAASAGNWAPGEATIISSKPKPPAERTKQRHEPQPFTAAELEFEEFPEPRWAVPGVLMEGLGLLAGKPKIGKSWMALNMALAIAEGGLCFNEIPCEDGEVLYLALEDTKRRLKNRIATVKRQEKGWPERMYLERQWPRMADGGLEALDAWLGIHPATRFVCIDIWVKFRPLPQQGQKKADIYAEDYSMMSQVKDLADLHQVAILLVHHYNKLITDDWTDSFSGSTGLTGAADTILGLFRPRGAQGQQEAVLKISGKDVEESDWAMELDNGVWLLHGDAGDALETRERREVLDAMRKLMSIHNTKGVTPKEIAPLLNHKGPTVAKAMARMEADGTIVRISHGVYGLPEKATGGGGMTVALSLSGEQNDKATGATAATAATAATQNGGLASFLHNDRLSTEPI